MKNQTIATAAEEALISLGRASTSEEIYAEIVRLGLYQFNTPNPEHVVETELKRYSEESPRSDKRDSFRFHINPDQTFTMATTKLPNTKKSPSIGVKRILRASDKEELIEELMSSRVGVFREIWRILFFAAQVGLRDGKRENLHAVDTGKGIDQATFGNSGAWPGILHLMALVEKGDVGNLEGTSESEDQRLQLFQQYANGGLSIMREFFTGRTVDLDSLLAFIDSRANSKNATVPNLDLTI